MVDSNIMLIFVSTLKNTNTMKTKLTFCDNEGIELTIGDTVKIIDVESLENFSTVQIGDIVTLTKLVDLESNYIEVDKNGETVGLCGFRFLKT